MSNASLPAYSPGGRGASAPVPGPEPGVSTQEVTSTITQPNTNRFSATPLYGESDGGFQAAEALIDPYTGPRAPASPRSPAASLTTPIIQQPRQQIPHSIHGSHSTPNMHYDPEPNAPHVQGWTSQLTNCDYVNYTAQANYQVHRSRQVPPPSGLPSLMEFATPAPAPDPTPPPASPQEIYTPYSPYSPYSTYSPYASPITPERDFVDAKASQGYLSVPSTHPPASGYQVSYVNISGNSIDTQTPVFVPQHHHPASMSSDTTSTGRDNVLPGEDILYDG